MRRSLHDRETPTAATALLISQVIDGSTISLTPGEARQLGDHLRSGADEAETEVPARSITVEQEERESMTKQDLIDKLKEMRTTAPRGELTAMTELFGILFDKEIRDCGSNGAEMGKGANIGNVEINDGRKLAAYVDPKPEVRRRWKP